MSTRTGNRLKASVLAAAVMILLLPAFMTPASAAQRVALVIGNANYDHVPVLANPLNDASAVGDALGRLGFEVTRLKNADESTLRRKLGQFRRAANAAEMAVVFYAGHGMEVNNFNFLVPTDARLLSNADVEFEAVPLDLVEKAVKGASHLSLIILDACRDNPFITKMRQDDVNRSIGRGLARMEPSRRNMLIAYAAEEGQVADDGKGGHSPFTEALLAHVEEPGLEVGLMFRKVRDFVDEASNGDQIPAIYSSLSSEGVYLAERPQPASPPMATETPVVTMPVDETDELAEREIEARENERAERAYKLAKQIHTVEAYKAVVERFSNTVYATFAQLDIDRLTAVGKPESVSPDAEPQAPPQEPASTTKPLVPAPEESPSAAAPLVVSALDSDLELAERRQIQLGLKALGFDPGPVDGLFGPRTTDELGKWMEAKGYAATDSFTREHADVLIAAAKTAAVETERRREEAERQRREAVQAERKRQEADRQRRAAAEAERRQEAERQRQEAAEAERRRQEADRQRREAAEAERKRQEELRQRQEAAEAERKRREADRKRREAAEAERLKVAAVQPEDRIRARIPTGPFSDCPKCPEMVVVPAGAFTMGSPSSEDERDGDEGPLRRVTIPAPFAVSKYEVTFSQWDACVAAGGCRSYRPDDEGWGRGRRPVINVSWEDAKAYVDWLSRTTGKRYRLLTEAEWEYAARAGTQASRYWGENTRKQCDHANGFDDSAKNEVDQVFWRAAQCDDGSRYTSPIGQFGENSFGLSDMLGNVREWVEDCWHNSYSGAPPDGSAWTSRGDCSQRVLRGGHWGNYKDALRAANRAKGQTDVRQMGNGIRVARVFTR